MNFLLQRITVSALGLSHLCETVMFTNDIACHSLRCKWQQSLHLHACLRFAAETCVCKQQIRCVYGTRSVSAHPLDAIYCRMLVHVGSQD